MTIKNVPGLLKCTFHMFNDFQKMGGYGESISPNFSAYAEGVLNKNYKINAFTCILAL